MAKVGYGKGTEIITVMEQTWYTVAIRVLVRLEGTLKIASALREKVKGASFVVELVKNMVRGDEASKKGAGGFKAAYEGAAVFYVTLRNEMG